MRRISGGAALLAVAMAAFALPAAASDDDQFKRTVGPWEVSGSNGVCSAALVKMPTAVVWILVSPDQGNDGGIMMTTDRLLTAEKDGWISVTATIGPNGKSMSRPAEVNDDPVGLYIPWKVKTDMAAMPDDWHLTVRGQGMILLDVDVHGFRAAVAALNECDTVTDKNSMS